MKGTLVLSLFVSFVATSCGERKSVEETEVTAADTTRFFDYDLVEYYHNDFPEKELDTLFARQTLSVKDSLRMGVIVGYIPADHSNFSFVEHMGNIGYKKVTIDPSDYAGLDSFFREKPFEEEQVAPCIPVYRDVLLFKKQGKITGTAKICFDCSITRITGTAKKTSSFGMNGDYKNLNFLLESLRKKGTAPSS